MNIWLATTTKTCTTANKIKPSHKSLTLTCTHTHTHTRMHLKQQTNRKKNWFLDRLNSSVFSLLEEKEREKEREWLNKKCKLWKKQPRNDFCCSCWIAHSLSPYYQSLFTFTLFVVVVVCVYVRQQIKLHL